MTTGAPNTASTGRTLQVLMNASDVFDTGKKDAGVTMAPFELDTLPDTTTVDDVQSRVITAKAYNSSNSNKKDSRNTTLSLVQGTKCVYLKMDGTQIAKQTCTPETTVQYVEVPQDVPASAIHVDPIGWYGSEPNTDATAPTISSYVQNHSSGWVRFDVYLEGYGEARKSYRFKIG